MTAQELFNGWIVRINSVKSTDDLLRWYERSSGVVQLCKRVPVLPFDQTAATQLELLLKGNPKLGKQRLQKDMRIAAIGLANNATVVTVKLTASNAQFFYRPILKGEDATAINDA